MARRRYHRRKRLLLGSGRCAVHSRGPSASGAGSSQSDHHLSRGENAEVTERYLVRRAGRGLGVLPLARFAGFFTALAVFFAVFFAALIGVFFAVFLAGFFALFAAEGFAAFFATLRVAFLTAFFSTFVGDGTSTAEAVAVADPRNCSRIAGFSSVDMSWVISSPRATARSK